jgi:Lrp/AsnC family leucine-responsive transcriptional regulator
MAATDLKVDDKSWQILATLQQDARASLKTLADAAGLSMPSTAERIKKLEEAGIIRGYHAEVAPEALGYLIKAIIGITTTQPHKRKFTDLLAKSPQVLECLHVTGADSYLVTVIARDMAELEAFLGRINVFGETRTSIVMSAPLARRGLQRPA